MQVAEARALLGLGENSSVEDIRADHRRLISLMHPDRGGTEALAQKINAARDVPLRHHDEKEKPGSPDCSTSTRIKRKKERACPITSTRPPAMHIIFATSWMKHPQKRTEER